MKLQTKLHKLGLTKEVENILKHCELYNPQEDKVTVEELNKLRKWEVMEVIGNYLDPQEKEVKWWDIKQLKTFCKAFEITEEEVSYYYARGMAESGYCLAYAVNEDVVLIIE